MIVVGLTGSIGMGKTTAAAMLRDMGIPVHDADEETHRLLGANGGAVTPVVRAFPETLKIDAEGRPYIDRHILGRIVFADRAKKRILEEILHPMVRAESDAFKKEMRRAGHEIVALDIPLLFETGGEDRVDVTICVTASPEVQRERVMARPGMTKDMFDKIVSGQMTDSEKRERADFILETDKGLDDTRLQLQKIIDKIASRGGKRRL